MITEIVEFDLPHDMTREQLIAKYRTTAPGWANNPDLLRKYYCFDAARGKAGGVYIWKDRAAALRWHGDAFRAMIRDLYGAEPSMTYLDTLLVVDNESARIIEP